MVYRKNTLKVRLASGHKGLGCWLHLESTMAAEVVALCGFDAVMIDHEHGPGSVMSAIALMQTLKGTSCTGLVRVPWNDPVYLKRILDAGAEGVMVPSVETADEAKAVVAACRYPPQGFRGAAHTIVRASSYGIESEQYLADNGRELMVICQIESAQAVANVDQLLAVEGVDMWFIGPMDLSASLGKPGQLDDPEFIALMRKAEKAVAASDKMLGGLAVPDDPPSALFERGYDFALGASDILMLRNAALEHIEKFNQ